MNEDNIYQTEDMIRQLEHVNYLIAEMNVDKQKLERELLLRFKRIAFDDNDKMHISKEGGETVQVGKYNLTMTTNYTYRINKKEYEVYKNHVRREFNPVTEKVSYELNKKAYREAMVYGDVDDKLMLSNFIELEPAKPTVKVNPCTNI